MPAHSTFEWLTIIVPLATVTALCTPQTQENCERFPRDSSSASTRWKSWLASSKKRLVKTFGTQLWASWAFRVRLSWPQKLHLNICSACMCCVNACGETNTSSQHMENMLVDFLVLFCAHQKGLKHEKILKGKKTRWSKDGIT